MSVEIEVLQDTTTITPKNTLDVKGSDTAIITDKGIKTVEATSNTYVINSGGMYSGNMNGNIPVWLDQAVTNAIADGTVTLSQALSDLDAYVKNMETGIHQSISNLQTADTTMNTLITTNKSESDNALAAIGQTLTTKITAADATAISQTVMGSEFNNPNSYITTSAWYVNNVKTYADATKANSTSLDAMASVVTDPTTGVTATANNVKTGYTTVGLNPDGTLNAGAGELGIISAKVRNNEAKIITTETVAATAKSWAASASKLIINPNTGAVTGWSMADGSGVQSSFKINANKFTLEDSNNATIPFLEIDNVAHTAKFNGTVTFGSSQINNTMGWGNNPPKAGADVTSANVSADTAKVSGIDANVLASTAYSAYDTANTANSTSNAALVAHVFAPNTTTIDGGKITTGTIDANRVNVINLNANNINTGTLNANNVTIANLKVLGTALLPGISKAFMYVQGSQDMPASSNGDSPPPYAYGTVFNVPKPYDCHIWSIMVMVSVSNNTNTANAKDLQIDLLLNGNAVSSANSTSGYNINVSAVGTYSGITGTSASVSVRTYGYHTAGTFVASYSVIAIVES